MCGFLGIFGDREVSKRIYTGLLSIQHRGQDAAGMITFSTKFHIKKGNGLVRDVFNEKNLSYLLGNIGIGHVRYPTIGSGKAEDAQPFYVNIPFGIILAHNGNITNYYSLKNRLEYEYNININSTSDSEILLNYLAHKLNLNLPFSYDSILKSMEDVFLNVKGSYSAVSYIKDKGFLAFRDPNGFKPIIMGKKGKEFIFASESVALDILGFDIVGDLKPGEVVFIDLKKNIYRDRIIENDKTTCIFEFVYFARPDSTIDGINVYEARLRLGRGLAKKIKTYNLDIDVVIPVPDTSRAAATAVAEELNLPHREGFIKNRYIGRTFIMPEQDLREESVQLKLNIIKPEVKNKKILVIDDSIVRGTTSREIVSLLRRNGAAKVYLGIYSPPVISPCYYGIDMQTKKEFIADGRSVEEIKRYIGADELIYQETDSLVDAVFGDKNAHCCNACFTSRYPIVVDEEEKRMIEKDRLRKHIELF